MNSLVPRAPIWARQRPVHSALQTVARRQFHATRPSPFVSEVIAVSTSLLHGVHSLSGLPWVASIPLTAVIVRMVVAFPLQIYSKIHGRRQQDIAPLVLSWSKHLQQMTMARGRESPEGLLPTQAQASYTREIRKRTRLLYRRWRINPYWRFVPFLQLPVWLSLMEGVRAMCGNEYGLLRQLFLRKSGESAAGADAIVAEPSFATEGALWFPNLLDGDPTGALPAIVSASLLVNILYGWKTPSLLQIAELPGAEMAKSLMSLMLKGAFMSLSVYAGYAAYMANMPAGLMIYWIASTNTATFQSWFLDRYMFMVKPLNVWSARYVGVLKPGERRPPVSF